MGKKNKGFCWCVHHDDLLEYCHDFAGRVAFIKKNKRPREVPIRLYEMRLVKGKLPQEVKEAEAKYERAYLEWNKAGAEYDEAKAEWHKIIKKHRLELEELHRKEVPDSCWDGKELDFEQAK